CRCHLHCVPTRRSSDLSAKGVIFMTLEDETGVANAIVWKKVFDTYRSVVMTARLVKIHGRLQSQSGVIHTVVEHIEDMTPMLGRSEEHTSELQSRENLV